MFKKIENHEILRKYRRKNSKKQQKNGKNYFFVEK
jgi:hypothetical protein